MRNKISVFVAAIAALVMVGCGSPDVTGKYKMEMDTSKVAADKKAQMDMVKGMFGSMEMELTTDKKAKMTVMGQTQEGTWAMEGGKVVVTDDKGQKQSMTIEGTGLIMDIPADKMKDMEGVKMKWVKQ